MSPVSAPDSDQPMTGLSGDPGQPWGGPYPVMHQTSATSHYRHLCVVSQQGRAVNSEKSAPRGRFRRSLVVIAYYRHLCVVWPLRYRHLCVVQRPESTDTFARFGDFALQHSGQAEIASSAPITDTFAWFSLQSTDTFAWLGGKSPTSLRGSSPETPRSTRTGLRPVVVFYLLSLTKNNNRP